jgi:hypothetical protein
LGHHNRAQSNACCRHSYLEKCQCFSKVAEHEVGMNTDHGIQKLLADTRDSQFRSTANIVATLAARVHQLNHSDEGEIKLHGYREE